MTTIGSRWFQEICICVNLAVLWISIIYFDCVMDSLLLFVIGYSSRPLDKIFHTREVWCWFYLRKEQDTIVVASILLLSLLMRGVSQCCWLLRVLSIMKLLSAAGLHYTESELCARLQRRAAAGRRSLRYKCRIIRQPSDCSHLHTSAAVATLGGLNEWNKGKKIL